MLLAFISFSSNFLYFVCVTCVQKIRVDITTKAYNNDFGFRGFVGACTAFLFRFGGAGSLIL